MHHRVTPPRRSTNSSYMAPSPQTFKNPRQLLSLPDRDHVRLYLFGQLSDVLEIAQSVLLQRHLVLVANELSVVTL